MHKIYTAAQAQHTDEYTIETIGVPSLVLMERAALCVTGRILQILGSDRSRPVVCVCGKGNNGADALCVARQLSEEDVNVSVFLCGEGVSMEISSGKKTDFDTQLDICRKTGIRFLKKLSIPSDAIVVEGVFGNGLDREVEGAYKDVIKKLNASEAYVVSIDIPGGINATTGEVMGTAVNADETVSFGSERVGHVLYPGAGHSGRVTVGKIGWQTDAAGTSGPEFFLLDDEDLFLMPDRPAYSHKGTFGSALVVAGSHDYGGAAVLCAKAAFMTGTGLVRVFTHEDNRAAVLSCVPEAIVTEYDTEDNKLEDPGETLEELKGFVKRADSVIVGPGLGKSHASVSILQCVLENAAGSVIMDADALNILADSLKEKTDGIYKSFMKMKKNGIVITPHIKEAASLLGTDKDAVSSDMPGSCRHLHNTLGVNVVLKSAVTVMTEGSRFFINRGGNSGMACAGSGDVLAGILGGLAARGLKGAELMRAGVYLHACAGELARERYGETGMLPSDVALCVRDVIKSRGYAKTV